MPSVLSMISEMAVAGRGAVDDPSLEKVFCQSFRT